MKKSILSIAASAFCVLSAFAQIPNNGFENWTAVGSYSVPNGWGTLNNTTAVASVYTATKGTPGSPGTSYLKLTSKTVATSVVNGIAVSGVLDSMTMTPKSGFAYNMRPASFTGKWQHMIYGSSQGSIQVILTRWDAGSSARVPVASGNVTLSGMAMSWANFTIPLTYTDGNNPDSCIIVMKASGANPTNNDYLWVDNLAFSGVVTGIDNSEKIISKMSVYPNPATQAITIDLNIQKTPLVKLQLIDVTGKLVKEVIVGEITGKYTATVDVNGIVSGTYFLKVIANDAVEVKKIILQ